MHIKSQEAVEAKRDFEEKTKKIVEVVQNKLIGPQYSVNDTFKGEASGNMVQTEEKM